MSDVDFCKEIHPASSTSLDVELQPIAAQLKDHTGVYILEDGAGSLLARAWLTEHATRTIDIQYFIFSTDNVGLIACDYLVRAADRGVQIRVLVDDIMVEADLNDIATFASHPNISLKIYNPGVNLGKDILQKIKTFATDFRSANQRMHNKTFIVDEKVVITGGRNVADEYFDYDHAYNFRDRDVLLMGEVIPSVQHSFEEFWEHKLSVPIDQLLDKKEQVVYDTTIFNRLHQYACNPDNFWPEIRKEIRQLPEVFSRIRNGRGLHFVKDVTFISDKPEKNETKTGLGGGGQTTDALMALVKSANKSIAIQSPYLVTTDLSRDLFSAAVERGVTIRILTNSLASTDNLEAFSGYQRDREKLLRTGVRVFEFKPDAAIRREIMTSALQRKLDFTPIFGLHSKTMIVDDSIVVIGTFNVDPRSANLNTECLAIIPSKNVARQVMTGIEIEFRPENAWETTLDFNPDHLVGAKKRIKTWSRKIVPKGIL